MADDLYDGHYQTEYKGPVGFEKKEHQTHFESPGVKLRSNQPSDHKWVETRPGRWVRVKKEE